MHSFNQIKRKYDAGEYKAEKPSIFKLRENYVFDEDLSVRKNRELVEEHNQRVYAAWREYNANEGIAKQKLEDDLIEAIIQCSEIDIKKETAKVIYDFAYREYHSGGLSEIITGLYDVIDFAKNILTTVG